MRLTPALHRHWLGFFRFNRDYRAYCKAKNEGDTEICARLEASFSKIAELYEDWGDIYQTDVVRDRKAYMEWIKGKEYRFYEYRTVRRVEDPKNHRQRRGHVLLSVPLGNALSDVVVEVEKALDPFYEPSPKGKTRKESPSFFMRLPTPKYKLHDPSGKLNAATVRAFRKAAYVAQYRRVKANGKPLSVTDTVLAIMQDPKNPLKWKLTPEDKAAVKRGTFAKSILGSSEVTLVKRYRKDFDAYVRNTIHGRFPDNS